MARVTVEDCLQRLNNRFMLVHLAARRVIQLRKGSKPLVEAPKNKEIVRALREIASGAVNQDNILQFELDQLTPETDLTPLAAPGAESQAQETLLASPEDLNSDGDAASDDVSLDREETDPDVDD
jgi:DNA-directed RNA polymerase subunit omega